ncbi:hypothetical protein AA21952_0890 [Acetobacter oeni LMG 21952]|nr:hypothetical protein AA21952_0890 [Acetobacter oeni LMG 21952]
MWRRWQDVHDFKQTPECVQTIRPVTRFGVVVADMADSSGIEKFEAPGRGKTTGAGQGKPFIVTACDKKSREIQRAGRER